MITPEIEARMRLLKMRARDAIQLLPSLPQEIGPAIEGLDSPSALGDFIAGIIDIPIAEKQDFARDVRRYAACLTSCSGCWRSGYGCCNSRSKSENKPSKPCHHSNASTSFANSFVKSRRSWATTIPSPWN